MCPQHLLASSKGIPDLLLFNPSFDGNFVGLAIEFKIDHASHPDTLKPDQQKWFGQLQFCKWRCVRMYRAQHSVSDRTLTRCLAVNG